MTSFKIECPRCQQHIECDERYCGMQINCPGCQGEMLIPQLPSASAPAPEIAPPSPVVRLAPAAAAATPAGSPPGIRVMQTSPPAATTTAARPVPIPRPLPTLPANDEGPGMAKGKKRALIGAVVVVVGVAGYFAFSALSGMQSKFNEARAKDDDPGLIGGQMGHIAELNSVLDATDPNKKGRFGNTKAVEGAIWTLDVAAAKIPQGDVVGLISGSYFSHVESMLTVGNGGILFSFVEEPGPPYERSVAFTTLFKTGEPLEGRSWRVSKEDPPGAMTVTKQWLDRNGGGRQQKSYKSGFALIVELGKPNGGEIPGKVYVSLPDPEKTVIGGNFVASIRASGAPPRPGRTGPGRRLPSGE